MTHDNAGLLPCPYRQAFEDIWALYCDHGLDLESAESIREIAMKHGLVIERPGSWDADARIMEEWGLEDGDPIYVYKARTPASPSVDAMRLRTVAEECFKCLARDHWPDKKATYHRLREALESVLPPTKGSE